jgi:death-on-curing protein
VIYLTKEDLLALGEEILPSVVLRDAGQLHAAILRPQTTVFGDDAYPGAWDKAAALMQSVVIGHPLLDGNKRLGWAAAVVFLALNGHELAYVDVEVAEALVISVATGELDDISELAKRLQEL